MKNHINQIMIFRQVVGDTWTRGQLYLNGEFIGYTLEDTLRPFPIKVPDHTAISSGVYYGEKYQSPTFGQCLIVDDVPLFTNIRIHGGNDHTDTRGCILLGKYKDDENGRIWECRPIMDLLYSKIDDSKPIVISITDAIGVT